MKIGFFDSGIGGITILKQAINKIHAHYLYLADNLHAPYGYHTKEEIEQYVVFCVTKLVEQGADIIVIACNTATMVAIDKVRMIFPSTVIIGTEPAIKLAKQHVDAMGGKILSVATSVTLQGEKYLDGLLEYEVKDLVDSVALNKLVKLIEQDPMDENDIEQYLTSIFPQNMANEYTSVVLGCTHFPHVKNIFKKVFINATIFDSSEGVVNRLQEKIGKIEQEDNSTVEWIVTKPEIAFEQKLKRMLS